MSLQAFKQTDLVEAKVRDAFLNVLTLLGTFHDDFYTGAYEAFPLGDVLYETGHPLAEAIPKAIFRVCFSSVNSLFSRPGTFEFYLTVFRKVWGEDVDVTFTVPDPGKLQIDIVALSTEANLALARKVIDNVYTNYEIVDEDGDNLIFQGTKGLQTLRQAEALVRELAPAGIWTETTLSIT